MVMPLAEYELEGEYEWEAEYEGEYESELEGETEEFFRAVAGLARRAAASPTLRRAGLSAARAALQGGLGPQAGRFVAGFLPQREGELEFEGEFELEGEAMAGRGSLLGRLLTGLAVAGSAGQVASDVINNAPPQQIAQDIGNLNDVTEGAINVFGPRPAPPGPVPPEPTPPPPPPPGPRPRRGRPSQAWPRPRGGAPPGTIRTGPGTWTQVRGGRIAPRPGRHGQREYEWEYEGFINPLRRIYPDAMMEHMGHAAAEAESEAEAEAFISAMMPLAARLAPHAGRLLRRAAPRLTAAATQAVRALRANPSTRPLVRTMPAVLRRTAHSIAQQAAQGRPVSPATAVRTLARQTAQVVSSPRLANQAFQRSQALDRRFHAATGGAGRATAALRAGAGMRPMATGPMAAVPVPAAATRGRPAIAR